MWNLLPIGADSNIYQPSSFTGTFIDSNAAYAYDKPSGQWDDYPYSTSALLDRSGSTTAGTPESSTAILSGWGTLAIANFTSATLYIGATIQISPDWYKTTDITTASILFEISYNAGSSWSTWQRYGVYNNGVMYPYTPASYTRLSTDVITKDTLTKIQLKKYIASSSFSTGLSDLQVRMTGYTLKTTLPTSSVVSLNIYDARVVVN